MFGHTSRVPLAIKGGITANYFQPKNTPIIVAFDGICALQELGRKDTVAIQAGTESIGSQNLLE